MAAALIALAGFANPASADIRAFNAAVQRVIISGAIAPANEAWPVVYQAHLDAASIAREFGWVAHAGRLAFRGAHLRKVPGGAGWRAAKPDASPAVSRVTLKVQVSCSN